MSDLYIILSEFLEDHKANFRQDILNNLRINLYKVKGFKILIYSYNNSTGQFLGKKTLNFSDII